MYVYIVMYEIEYEGGSISKVFSRKKDADEYAERKRWGLGACEQLEVYKEKVYEEMIYKE